MPPQSSAWERFEMENRKMLINRTPQIAMMAFQLFLIN
jgi:hypothetical protein